MRYDDAPYLNEQKAIRTLLTPQLEVGMPNIPDVITAAITRINGRTLNLAVSGERLR